MSSYLGYLWTDPIAEVGSTNRIDERYLANQEYKKKFDEEMRTLNENKLNEEKLNEEKIPLPS